jgi:hypothetical protein
MKGEACIEVVAIFLSPSLGGIGLPLEAGTLALFVGTETDIREGEGPLLLVGHCGGSPV